MCYANTDSKERQEAEGHLLHRRNFIYPIAELGLMRFAPGESWEVGQQLENLSAGWRRSPWWLPSLELRRGRWGNGGTVRSSEVPPPAVSGESKGFQEAIGKSGVTLTRGRVVRRGDGGDRDRTRLWAIAFQMGKVALYPCESWRAG